MFNTYGKTLAFPAILLLSGCIGNKQTADDGLTGHVNSREDIAEVRTVPVRYGRFETEIVSNGKAEACIKANIPFKSGEFIKQVNIKNGVRVSKGDILVELDPAQLEPDLAAASAAFGEAKLTLLEKLYSEGVKSMDDTVSIPYEKLQNIKLRSGYTAAENTYGKARQDFANLKIRAPFSGIVADCKLKPFNPVSMYDNGVCTLIDDSEMEVVFKVMESEVKNIGRGMSVEISPYVSDTLKLRGTVTEVNPRVDANGMVSIKAATHNRSGILMDGMNVSVLVKRKTDNRLIIPKSAVLPRQGRKVVFTCENGKAQWKYVTIGEENSTECTVEEGLSKGEMVIWENNLGLSHDSPVKVVP